MKPKFPKGIYAETFRNWKAIIVGHPMEESFGLSSDGSIMTAADGVTRDPFEHLPKGNFLGKLKFSYHYPRDSPAKKAADIFCNDSVIYLERNYGNITDRMTAQALVLANSRIWDFNQQKFPNFDYLTKDRAACVGVVAAVQADQVHLSYICDSGLAIFNQKGDLKFRTENDGPAKHDDFIWQDPALQGANWRDPATRIIIRRDYRNNPQKEHSFGVLNGQSEAESYIRSHSQPISQGDRVVAYTDDLENLVYSGKFADAVRKDDYKMMKRLCKQNVSTEGTLIYKKIF